MGQPFSTLSPNAVLRKPTVIAVIIAVVVIHISALWLISLLPPTKLKAVEKTKPIQVTIVSTPVQPVEDIPVKKPKQQPKPQAKPKAQPQATVKKTTASAEKKKTLSSKTVKDTQEKKVQRSDDSEKEDSLQSKQDSTTTEVTRRQKDEQSKDKDDGQQDKQSKGDEKKDTASSQKVSLGKASWKREPVISRKALLKYLKKEDGLVVIRVLINSDAMGNVTQVKVTTSSSNQALDDYVIQQVKKAKFKPYQVDGVNVPFEAPQEFNVGIVN